MQTTREFKVVQAKCRVCSTELTFPRLPELSYGLFLAKNLDGEIYRYYDFNNSDEWSYVSRYLEEINHRSKMYYVLGNCIDEVDDQLLSIAGNPICSRCKSSQFDIIDEETLGSITLQSVSFVNFNMLDDLGKKNMLNGILEIIRPQINEILLNVTTNLIMNN